MTILIINCLCAVIINKAIKNELINHEYKKLY